MLWARLKKNRKRRKKVEVCCSRKSGAVLKKRMCGEGVASCRPRGSIFEDCVKWLGFGLACRWRISRLAAYSKLPTRLLLLVAGIGGVALSRCMSTSWLCLVALRTSIAASMLDLRVMDVGTLQQAVKAIEGFGVCFLLERVLEFSRHLFGFINQRRLSVNRRMGHAQVDGSPRAIVTGNLFLFETYHVHYWRQVSRLALLWSVGRSSACCNGIISWWISREQLGDGVELDFMLKGVKAKGSGKNEGIKIAKAT